MEKSRLSRITEWWRPKAGTIFSLLLFYLAVWEVPFSDGWKLLFFSLITLTGFGVTGYFLNDWADIPYDRKVGKTNLVERIPKIGRVLLFVGLLAITLLPWFTYFKTDVWSIGLITAQLVLQFAYPIPPIRLKNYPKIAMASDAMYAFAIPSVLAWHTFDLTSESNGSTEEYIHFAFLFLWMIAIGIRHIINHHVVDRKNDEQTSTPNLANSVEPLKLRGVIQSVLFPIELFAGLAFLSTIFRSSNYFVLVMFLPMVIAGAKHLKLTYPFFTVSFSSTWLDKFTSFYFGLVSAIWLLLCQSEYWIVLLIFLILFSGIGSHPFVSIVSKWLKTQLIKRPVKIASFIVNWSLFYFRKVLLGWSDERNFGEHYTARLELLEVKKRKEKGIVAVFNQNLNKYTETFVQGHINNLPFHVVSFHGWPSPVFVNDMENLISGNQFLVKLKHHIWHLLNLDASKMEDRLIGKRLIEENVDVMLAEFGTMGARLVSISMETGIPVVPIFYGYDAWHSNALTENKESYQQLFEVAPKVFGVSKDICQQLVKLGCSAEKVEYLPCFVDLERFSYVVRDFSEPNFLSIGRFCATKAPFLTIMAFRKVVDKIPNAKLTMIGGDENGVLETCQSLIKSLNLQDSILIPGVLSPEEINGYMQKASIFVQHSVTTPITGDKEGTPVAIMEAMATGLPVISTKHAGIAEMIENGVSGILVDEYNSEQMTQEMIALIGDKQRMKSLGEQASKSIHSNELLTHHIERLTDKIETLIVR